MENEFKIDIPTRLDRDGKINAVIGAIEGVVSTLGAFLDLRDGEYAQALALLVARHVAKVTAGEVVEDGADRDTRYRENANNMQDAVALMLQAQVKTLDGVIAAMRDQLAPQKRH